MAEVQILGFDGHFSEKWQRLEQTFAQKAYKNTGQMRQKHIMPIL